MTYCTTYCTYDRRCFWFLKSRSLKSRSFTDTFFSDSFLLTRLVAELLKFISGKAVVPCDFAALSKHCCPRPRSNCGMDRIRQLLGRERGQEKLRSSVSFNLIREREVRQSSERQVRKGRNLAGNYSTVAQQTSTPTKNIPPFFFGDQMTPFPLF